VLGPVEVWDRDQRYPAGTLKEQRLLAILLLEAGRVVSAQTLAERLWDDQIPGRARETLQVYISRLRRNLRAAGDTVGVIGSSPAGGYRLDVSANQVDARQFEALLARAHAAYAKPNPQVARDLLVQAEALWLGEPLEGLSGQWADATRHALGERRRSANLARIDLDLRLGRDSGELVGELTAMTAAGRIDQKLVGLLMKALNSAGRQDEALAVFRETRVRLREELGVGPRAELEALHRQILRGDPTLTPQRTDSPDSTLAPHTLDRDPPHLTGRDEELQEMLGAIRADLNSPAGIAVFALNGMAGIGKTALAVHAAHRLAAHCPDGVLQINLHTHDPHEPAVGTHAALLQLLDATATPSDALGRADSLDSLTALWRRRGSGRRLLILLDDVLDADQVRPLLPVAPGNIALLTSRRRLLGLHGAHQRTVPPLDDTAATQLLARITDRQFPDQEDELDRFSRHCSGLPLAITVNSAYLRAHPSWELADLVDRMAIPLSSAADDQLTGPVRAAFAMSYRALSPHLQALLCRVAAQPGQDFGLLAAAALADATPEETDLALDTLTDHHLVEETGRHRYRLHDLLRAFAIGQVQQEGNAAETDAAIGRMLDFYVSAAARAELTLRPYRRIANLQAPPRENSEPAIEDSVAAQAWLDRESANLTAFATYALTRPTGTHVGLLPCILAPHLDRRGRWRQAVDLLSRALDATAQTATGSDGAPTAQLMADLAAAYVRTGELDEALVNAHGALDAWNARGDGRGQADALLEIGRIHFYANRLARAAQAYEQSADFYRQIAESRGQAVADYHRGIVVFQLGRHDEAFALGHTALESARRLEIPALECDILTDIGEMYRLTDDSGKALEFFEQAQPLADRQGDPHNIAVLATNIGAVYYQRGDYEAALVSLREAIQLFRALGDRRNEVDTLLQIAETLQQTDDYASALQQIQCARELADLIRDPLRQSRVQLTEGRLRHRQGRNLDALRSFRAALAFAEQACAPTEQEHARQAIADISHHVGKKSTAKTPRRTTRPSGQDSAETMTLLD
jgi:DNA-binding SARP family transcriptional activator/tetratricopeptide (TPR) repeat protein